MAGGIIKTILSKMGKGGDDVAEGIAKKNADEVAGGVARNADEGAGFIDDAAPNVFDDATEASIREGAEEAPMGATRSDDVVPPANPHTDISHLSDEAQAKIIANRETLAATPKAETMWQGIRNKIIGTTAVIGTTGGLLWGADQAIFDGNVSTAITSISERTSENKQTDAELATANNQFAQMEAGGGIQNRAQQYEQTITNAGQQISSFAVQQGLSNEQTLCLTNTYVDAAEAAHNTSPMGENINAYSNTFNRVGLEGLNECRDLGIPENITEKLATNVYDQRSPLIRTLENL